MPLLILHPDNKGNTALDYAIRKKNQRAFERMIDLLEPYDDQCLSKMMLNSFELMIRHSTDLISNYFETAIY